MTIQFTLTFPTIGTLAKALYFSVESTDYYRSQTKFIGKIIFLQASVILFTGGRGSP